MKQNSDIKNRSKTHHLGWGKNNPLKWKTTEFSDDVNRMVLHRPEQ